MVFPVPSCSGPASVGCDCRTPPKHQEETLMAQTVVFVLGVGRSGSTVLNLLLGSHTKFVGLGEVHSLFRDGSPWMAKTDQIHCSCGPDAESCPFWMEALERLRAAPETDEAGRYGRVLACFEEAYGADKVPVDISKSVRALRILRQVPGVTVKVIHLIRDVRAWAVSRRRALKREGLFRIRDVFARGGRQIPRYLAERFATGLFWEWYLRNRRQKRYLAESGLPVFQLGYEEMVLYPQVVWPRLFEFLGAAGGEETIRFDASNSHCILGNRMRKDDRKRRRLQYDARWMWWGLDRVAAVLSPHIMRFNAREVYSNVGRATKGGPPLAHEPVR